MSKRGSSRTSDEPRAKRRKDNSGRASRYDDDESDSDGGGGRGMRPLKKRRAAAASRRVADSDSESESGGGGAVSDESFDDGYDDDFMGDEADRARLEAMTEMERETILAQRAEKRQEAQERREVRKQLKERALKQREQDEKAMRRQKRNKVSEKTRDRKARLEEMKAKKQAAKRRQADLEDEEDGQVSSEDEAGGAGDDDDDRYSPSRDTGADVHALIEDEDYGEEDEDEDAGPPATCKQINAIRLLRHQLAQWLYEPFFEKMVTGAFVRVGVGSGTTQRYRMYEVVGVDTTSKQYTVENESTDKVLVVQGTSGTKKVNMQYVSQKNFTQSEYAFWLEMTKKIGRHVITSREVLAKRKELESAANYVHTEADILHMVNERKKLGMAPKNPAAEKTKLLVRLAAARERGDVDEEAQLTEAVKAVEELARVGRTKSSVKLSGVERINERNRSRNYATLNVQSQNDRGNKKNAIKDDPFQRAASRPEILWAIKPHETDKEELLKAAEEKKKAEAARLAELKRLRKSTARKNLSEAAALIETHKALDLNINVDAIVGQPIPIVTSSAAKKRATSKRRR